MKNSPAIGDVADRHCCLSSKLRYHTDLDSGNDKYLEYGRMPNVMVALPNIGGAICSTLQSLADAHYYTVSQKKGATLTMAVTLSILDRFAKFFHYCKDQ